MKDTRFAIMGIAVKRTPKRAINETTATYSLPKDLKRKFAKLAEKKLLNASAMLRLILDETIKEEESKNGPLE